MKKYRITLLLLCFLPGFFTSCNDWLDLESDSKIVQEELFSNYDGYRTALNGIYRLMGSPELYAREYTWGLASVLGQNYKEQDLEYGYGVYLSYAQGEYEEKNARSIAENLWLQGYNTIANCNNLIAHTVNQDEKFFPEGQLEKDIILGEARGLRGLMHFDLLRLFAPAPSADDGNKYIPYVTVYPTRQPQRMTVSEVLDSVISDLEFAKKTLAYNDTLYNMNACSNVTARMQGIFSSSTSSNGGLFFSFRGTRLNYFAASALLARVYLYKGDKLNAYRCALDTYHFASDKQWFRFTSSDDIAPFDANSIYRKLYDGILLAFTNQQMYNLYDQFYNSQQGKLTLKNTVELFVGDADDYRLTKLISSTKTSIKWEKPVGSTWAVTSVITYQGPLAPVIRLSEVYYIMCECLAENQLGQAIDLLNTLRIARGAKTKIPLSTSKNDFLLKLKNDVARDMLAEGQTFFLYKRLNEPLFNGSTSMDMNGKYVLPIPFSEIAY